MIQDMLPDAIRMRGYDSQIENRKQLLVILIYVCSLLYLIRVGVSASTPNLLRLSAS